MTPSVHPVDQRLPLIQTAVLGFQHVLVMYSACIIVPLILGAALKLPKDQLTLIINADLFAAGLATLLQCAGNRFFGIQLPIMMGVTFASVTPMIAIAVTPGLGLPGVYGAIIASGLFGFLFAPVMGRLLRYFPPVVTGTVLLVIGISLMRVGIDWSAGGQPTLADGGPNPDYGNPVYLAISLAQLLLILGLNRFAKGFIANIAVLLGVLVGFVIAFIRGDIVLDGIAQTPWFSTITPFAFGLPTFDAVAVISMCMVMLVTMVESTGMFLALGSMVDRPTSRQRLVRGLRADGMGAIVGGVFNAFPYTSFSQNIGLVTMTGVKSRYVCIAGALILIALGLFPKLAYVVASTPQYVLGAAGMVMFGMVTLMGVRILSTVDFEQSRYNLLIAATSVGIGMIPMVSPLYFHHLPQWSRVFTESGIILSVLTALILNLVFNGPTKTDEAQASAARNAVLGES
ncbi:MULTISPECIES: nucleobase:cation symporter-2 family protein [Pseudomonas]|uniref:Xanthine permease n=1 Tax=Pseudomonas putida (strain W619) TaxID=390235 RepID=B1JAA4_PSEPW|nr:MULTISPECIES: nucleobase:cation symporter-2 family protein [Pseudomonas]MBG6127490.1 xanthine permease [Pseudomonas sp. M2]NSX23215.1 purine permease [Pseudomonas putida]QQE82129.1 purine permease [Pseudomonas putida]GLH32898.1 permease [Pseudomonas sp. BR1R-5]HDS1746562.1 purine permease [Pseudomonas putida]